MKETRKKSVKLNQIQRGRVFRVLRTVGLFALTLWLATVVLYRFITPPVTPLVLIRSIEYLLNDKPLVRAWIWKSLEEIPIHVRRAVVAAEDGRFMDHWGLDLAQLREALRGRSRTQGMRGASTITMQTVKNLFLWPSRSYLRKAFEICMAPVAGVLWGKRRTLELYLNVIEWGEGVYGIEAAARHYFRCSASQLSPNQAALLASILPNPRRLSPSRLSTTSRRTMARVMTESRNTRVP